MHDEGSARHAWWVDGGVTYDQQDIIYEKVINYLFSYIPKYEIPSNIQACIGHQTNKIP